MSGVYKEEQYEEEPHMEIEVEELTPEEIEKTHWKSLRDIGRDVDTLKEELTHGVKED